MALDQSLDINRNCRATIAYDGAPFLGWQKTREGTTVEGEIERALQQLLGKPTSLQAASRTDKGVHAEGQVINFLLQGNRDLSLLRRQLNSLLRPRIAFRDLQWAPETFHPTLQAKGKRYEYFLCTGKCQSPFHRAFSWYYPFLPLDLDRMRQGAIHLIGTHDFSSFSPEKGEDPIRTVERIEIISLESERVQIVVEGKSFLYRMVRTIVGTLVEVGTGALPIEALPEIIESRDRRRAGTGAPAHGLFLKEVFY